MNDFYDIMQNKVLVLDGSTRTYVMQKYNLKKYEFHKNRFMNHKVDLYGFVEILNITYPEIIKEVHEKYLKSGADIIRTNTHSANEYFLHQKLLDGLSYEINYASAKLAREVAAKYSLITRNKPRYVFGTIGPIEAGKGEQVNYEQVYLQQIKGLLAGRVDALLLECFTNLRNLFAVLDVINSVMEKRMKQVWVAIAVTKRDATQDLILTEGVINEIEREFPRLKILAIGENCGLGPEEVFRDILEFSKQMTYPIIAFPNNGLTYDMPYSAAQFGALAKRFMDNKLVNILGGCCGTTPEYTEIISKLAKDAEPFQFIV